MDTLDAWIDRFVFIEEGSKVADLSRLPHMAVYTFSEFEKVMDNKRVGSSKLVTKWMSCAQRRTVRGITYFPSDDRIVRQDSMEFFNTYYAPVAPAEYAMDKIRTWLDHMRYLIPDKASAKLMIRWLAKTVQEPHIRIPWAPLLISNVGVGKSWITYAMERVLGTQNVNTVKVKDLDSDYNGYMSQSTLVSIEEIRSKKRYDMVEDLKVMITASKMMVNHKYGGQGNERIFANVIAYSNWTDALVLQGDDERRWWVWQIEAPKQPPEYYASLYDWADTDGPLHLRAFLMSLDLSDFDFGATPPMTEAKRNMISQAKTPLEKLFDDCILERSGPFGADVLSLNVISDHIAKGLGTPELHPRHQSEVTKLVSLKAVELQTRLSDGIMPVRAICIRNSEHWRQQPKDVIQAEYIRAKNMALNLPTQANLRAVT